MAIAAKQILDEIAGNTKKETILYRHFNKDNQLLYVGISFSVMARLQKHSKLSPWWRNISHITFERFPSRAAAIAAEQMAIDQERPLHNIMGNQRIPLPKK
jgi:predicted GIY-YIG superfamily endonuclease